jgi:hypothetical protein
MTIDSMIDDVLDSFHNNATRQEETEVAAAVAGWLKNRGWYCCDGNAELRETALSDTDLVEPGNDGD